ncbi:hypothetical protein DFH06DRAFT_1139186 [Mycena polygramma]|nr:hypothetical protein DFH06DRAFT_1139186 [Mycena polygramma]
MTVPRARALSPEVMWCIGAFGGEETQRALLQTSKGLYRHLCPLRYRFIAVGDDAALVVHTLSQNSFLPPLVQGLRFSDYRSRVNMSEWESILPAMFNLRMLEISERIPLPRAVLPLIRFQLISLTSSSHLSGGWVELLASQPSLTSIRVALDFVGTPPAPHQLPELHSVIGSPATLAKFVGQYPLLNAKITRVYRRPLREHLQVFAASPCRLYVLRVVPTHFLILLQHAPSILEDLHYLMLDEQETWLATVELEELKLSSDTYYQSDPPFRGHFGALGKVVEKLHTLVHLQSLFLYCARYRDPSDLGITPGPLRLLGHADASYFSRELSPRCTSSSLRTFHFYAADGSVTMENWGTVHEEMHVRSNRFYASELDLYYMYVDH